MLLSTIISNKRVCKQAGARKLAAWWGKDQDQVYTVPNVGKVIARYGSTSSKDLIIEDAKGNQVVANEPFAIAFNHWLKAGKPGNVFLTSGAHKELEGKGYSLNAVRIPGQYMEGRRARLTPAKDLGFVDLYNKKRNKIPENVWRAIGESFGWLPKTNGGVTFNLQTKTVPAIIPNPIQTPHKATRTSKPIQTPHKPTRRKYTPSPAIETLKQLSIPHKPTRKTDTAKPAIKTTSPADIAAQGLEKLKQLSIPHKPTAKPVIKPTRPADVAAQGLEKLKQLSIPHKPTRGTYTAKPAIKKEPYAADSAKALLKFFENILYEDIPQHNKINKRIK